MLCRGRYRGRPLVPSPGSDGAPVLGGMCWRCVWFRPRFRDLEGWQVRFALVYCVVVDLIVSILVLVDFLFHDVELDLGGEAAKGFPE